MSRWWRCYADAHRNPKIARLSDKDFRLWHRLLCIASENDGKIPPASDLKLLLSARLDHLLGGLDRLIRGGLIDALDDGYEPHNWSEKQYKSDTSTPRVQRFRNKRNVSETAPDTETDTEVTLAKANADSDVQFWAAAKAFLEPERKNPGSLIGKWRKDHGLEATANAITRAQLERPVQRIPFIEGCLRTAKVDEPRLGALC